MTFLEEKNGLINLVEGDPDHQSDPTLVKIISLLKKINSAEELVQQKKILTHSIVDGVKNMKLGEIVLNFVSGFPRKNNPNPTIQLTPKGKSGSKAPRPAAGGSTPEKP